DPLLDAITPGILGDQTQDRPKASASREKVAVAMVSSQSSPALERPTPEAVPEVAWPLPVLWDSRELPQDSRSPLSCGGGMAVLAQSSQSQKCDQLGEIPEA